MLVSSFDPSPIVRVVRANHPFVVVVIMENVGLFIFQLYTDDYSKMIMIFHLLRITKLPNNVMIFVSYCAFSLTFVRKFMNVSF